MYGSRDTPRRRLVEEIEDLVRALASASERLGHAFAGRNHLHPTDLMALLEVMQAEGRGESITAGELTSLLGLTPGAITGVVDRLERAGHLRRERDAADRRKVRLHYGERGAQLAASFFGPLGQRSAEVMATFTDDELRVVHRFLSLSTAATAAALNEVQDGTGDERSDRRS